MGVVHEILFTEKNFRERTACLFEVACACARLVALSDKKPQVCGK